jgi:hypothetical protein
MCDIGPSQFENSFLSIFHYEGRDIPIEVVGPLPEDMDEFLDAVAEFLWKNRNQPNKV